MSPGDAERGADAPELAGGAGAGRPSPSAALGALLLFAITLVAYLPALRAGYLWDEDFVTDSPLLESAEGLAAIWTEPGRIPHEEHYWPLPYTTFWLEANLFGRTPAVFHTTNVLLHALASWLVWRVLRRLGLGRRGGGGGWTEPALLAAALFAVHPVHVESVAWIIERKDVLSACFYFGTALLWLRSDERGSRGGYAAALVLFVAALLSKSIVVTLPFALALGLWYAHGRVEPRQWRALAPLLALAVGGAAFDALYAAGRTVVEPVYGLLDRVLVAGGALWFYAGKALLPLGLAPIYPRWEVDAAAPLAYAPLAAAVLLPLVLFVLRHRVGRGPLAVALYFGGTLGPVLGLVEFSFYSNFAFVADRFGYLASLAPIALVAWVLARLVGRAGPAVRAAALVLPVAALGTLTWRTSSHYEDLLAFADFVSERNPATWAGPTMRGEELMRRREFPAAEAAFRAGLELRPDYPPNHANLGLALVRQGRPQEALPSMRRAVELQPGHWRSQHALGILLYELQDLRAALDHLGRAAELAPGEPTALASLGRLLAATGRLEQAIGVLGRAVELDPTHEDARRDLALARQLQSRVEGRARTDSDS